MWTVPGEYKLPAPGSMPIFTPVLPDPHHYVVERITRAMDRYMTAFHLFDANTLFDRVMPGVLHVHRLTGHDRDGQVSWD